MRVSILHGADRLIRLGGEHVTAPSSPRFSRIAGVVMRRLPNGDNCDWSHIRIDCGRSLVINAGVQCTYRPAGVSDGGQLESCRCGRQRLADELLPRVPLRQDPGAHGRLSAELKRQRKAGGARDLQEFLASDRAFHAVTIEDTENSILTGFYASLRDRQMRMIGESTGRDPQRITTIIDEHHAIAGAIRDGSLPRALWAVEHHASTVRALGMAVDA
jgi:hypothetical protein